MLEECDNLTFTFHHLSERNLWEEFRPGIYWIETGVDHLYLQIDLIADNREVFGLRLVKPCTGFHCLLEISDEPDRETDFYL